MTTKAERIKMIKGACLYGRIELVEEFYKFAQAVMESLGLKWIAKHYSQQAKKMADNRAEMLTWADLE